MSPPYRRASNIVTLDYGAHCRGLLSGRLLDLIFDEDHL
jgi:hypothetical protein